VPACAGFELPSRRTLTAKEKGGIEDLFKKQVPRLLYRRYNATKHVITFHNGSNLFFGHVKTDADLLQYQGAEFLFIGWEELTQFTYRRPEQSRHDATPHNEWSYGPCQKHAQSHAASDLPSNDATCCSSALPKAQTASLAS
jgi:hypothetical protein